ncbi:MAG: Asp23/Gls24 family envelope stress response protein [Actinobacteria bacterium]|nr:Asp23/Gls24 family envelope stress response protein [Actinomycetota bacterium]
MKEDARGENIDVSSEAIAALASQAASDIEGVTVIQQRPVESLTSRVKREFVHMGVKVNREEEAYRLSIYIRVDYGKSIPDLAWEIKNKVKEYVEGLTDIKIEEVEIIVEDIEPPS